MNLTYFGFLNQLNPNLIAALVLWSVLWKGLALWHSAKNNQIYWFVFLMVINTFGFIDIFYLMFYRSDKNDFENSLQEIKYLKRLSKKFKNRLRSSFKR